jgi:ribosomal protein L21E
MTICETKLKCFHELMLIFVPQTIYNEFTDNGMVTVEGIPTAWIVIELSLHEEMPLKFFDPETGCMADLHNKSILYAFMK